MRSTSRNSPSDKHSIEDILRHYGAELPYGRSGWVKVRCPFHDDSHASAAVNFQENQFKCFACDVGGDPYDLISNQEGLNFVEAIQFAERISPTGGAVVLSKRGSGRELSSRKRTNLGRRGSLLDRSS